MIEAPLAPILADIAAQHEEGRSSLAVLSEEQAGVPTDGPWSAIDTLPHVTAWIENGLRVALLQAQPGEPDPGPTRIPAGHLHIHVDRFSAQVSEAHRGWTREQALEWSERVDKELLAALTRLPLERVLRGAGRHGARMWYWMPAFIHSRGHRRRAMPRLLGSVD